METQNPQTLIDAIRYFSDPDVALEFVSKLRWPSGVQCPTCGRKDVRFIATRRLWECKSKHPKRQFSVKLGTIMEDSALPLDKWLAAIWMIANAKNGVSSYEIHRALGITQKSAWFMMHRIRLAMQNGSLNKLRGQVEVDETYIGGKARNMHRQRRPGGTGGVGKAIVMGLLERHGEVRTAIVDNPRGTTLRPVVHAHVEKGSEVYTDALSSYAPLSQDFLHQVVDHAECYVKGNVHTNCLENFWSLLKRGLKGTYIAVEPFHLFRYLDEQAFRFNNRKVTDSNRFTKALSSIGGKRLSYAVLTNAVAKKPAV